MYGGLASVGGDVGKTSVGHGDRFLVPSSVLSELSSCLKVSLLIKSQGEIEKRIQD
jgi:hypothetical protein